MVKVSIPLLLKDVTGGSREANIEGSTVREVVAALDAIYPGIGQRICKGEKISPNIAIVVDGKIAAEGLDTPVGPEAHVGLLPAFGGG
ncbi:MAG TPA: MoaD/ThiS family protein [Thermoguttaceae bacterium]|nr:MoaD/ThiS family protein [Thermoguttaceae bacterium]